MERKKNDGIFPIRFVAFMLAVFVGVMGLPILMTAMNGGLDLPVEYSYRAGSDTLAAAPAAGWTIQEVRAPEGSPLRPELNDGGMAVCLDALSAGEAASLQLLCRGEDGETQVDLQVSRDGTGIALRTVPEGAAAANVSYLFEYPANA